MSVALVDVDGETEPRMPVVTLGGTKIPAILASIWAQIEVSCIESQDALTLVAHVNPEECPSYQQLLGGGALQNLAREANACIIRSSHTPSTSKGPGMK